MISLFYLLSLILFHLIINVQSQKSPRDILGPSACECFGMDYDICGIPNVPVEKYPLECSSFIYNFFYAQDNTFYDMGGDLGSIKGYLDQLTKTNISVLVYYFYLTQQEWCAAVQCDTARQTSEMNIIKSLLDKYPGVKGIILYNLLDAKDNVTLADCPDYTKNVKNYIDLMRKTFPKISIGIHVYTKELTEIYNNPSLAWLDYNVLNPSVDFYIIKFPNLNNCTDEFTKTGTYPLSGKNNNTVDAIKTFLDFTGVALSKAHYMFYNYGISMDVNDECCVFPFTYCKNVQKAKTSMCADTLQTLWEKGAYTNKNGAGFVVSSIDLDDFDCSCQCGQSFPGFYALLNGYNGAPPPQPCALFDRI